MYKIKVRDLLGVKIFIYMLEREAFRNIFRQMNPDCVSCKRVNFATFDSETYDLIRKKHCLHCEHLTEWASKFVPLNGIDLQGDK
jgi:hypothetical protein